VDDDDHDDGEPNDTELLDRVRNASTKPEHDDEDDDDDDDDVRIRHITPTSAALKTSQLTYLTPFGLPPFFFFYR
jgi:hypothetical protein